MHSLVLNPLYTILHLYMMHICIKNCKVTYDSVTLSIPMSHPTSSFMPWLASLVSQASLFTCAREEGSGQNNIEEHHGFPQSALNLYWSHLVLFDCNHTNWWCEVGQTLPLLWRARAGTQDYWLASSRPSLLVMFHTVTEVAEPLHNLPRLYIYMYSMVSKVIPYSGKLSRDKTFADR